MTDRVALAVQPDRIRVIRARGGETLSSLLSRNRNQRISAQQISLLNRLSLDQPLESGRLIKMLEAGR